jgi:hypothetical protein
MIMLNDAQYNELDNRLDAVKAALADLQTALGGLDYMDSQLSGKLFNAFGVNEWRESLDIALGELVDDINEQTGVEFTAE